MTRRIAASLLLLLLAIGGTSLVAQEDEEEVSGMRVTSEKLVLQTVDEVYLSPHGTFVHESRDYSIAFSKGQGTQVMYKGADEEMHEVEIDRLDVSRGRLLIYPKEKRVRGALLSSTPPLMKDVRSFSPEDGVWKDSRTGAELEFKDGRIIKCKGLEKS